MIMGQLIVLLFKIVETLNISLEGTDFMDYESVLEPLGYAVEETEQLIHCSVDDITSELIKFVYDQMYFIRILHQFEHD